MSRFEGTVRAPWEPYVSGIEAEKARSSGMGARKEGCGENSGGVEGEGQIAAGKGNTAPELALWGGGKTQGYKAQSCRGSGAWDLRGV